MVRLLCSPPPPQKKKREEKKNVRVLFAVSAEQAAETENAGSSWTGWAVSSLTSKLYRGGHTPAGPAEPEKNKTSGKQENAGNTYCYYCCYYLLLLLLFVVVVVVAAAAAAAAEVVFVIGRPWLHVCRAQKFIIHAKFVHTTVVLRHWLHLMRTCFWGNLLKASCSSINVTSGKWL